ncbi:MAG: hypothetical protein IPO33_02240 [Saprospiraceae bacterium]|nr:hypothetical protein [Candidatus Brachybacter algidus]
MYAENALNVLNTNATSVIILNSLLGPGYNMQYGTALNTIATSGIQEYQDNRFEASAGFKLNILVLLEKLIIVNILKIIRLV